MKILAIRNFCSAVTKNWRVLIFKSTSKYLSLEFQIRSPLYRVQGQSSDNSSKSALYSTAATSQILFLSHPAAAANLFPPRNFIAGASRCENFAAPLKQIRRRIKSPTRARTHSSHSAQNTLRSCRNASQKRESECEYVCLQKIGVVNHF